jgi:hypothetical protein
MKVIIVSVCIAQSRQRTRLFLQSSESGPPHPLTCRQVCPLLLWFWGEGTQLLTTTREGVGDPNSDEGTDTVALFVFSIYTRFFPRILQIRLKLSVCGVACRVRHS